MAIDPYTGEEDGGLPPLTVDKPKFTIKRIGRTWAVVNPSGDTVEGGFFGRVAAERAAERYALEAMETATYHAQREREMGRYERD